MVLVLPDLAALLILFGALIFIYLCVGIAKALFGLAGGTLGKLPVVGGWINSGLHTVEHKIVSVMTGWADGLDASIGWALHEIAREVDWLGAEIKAHASLLYTLGAITLGPGFASAIHSALGLLHTRVGGIEGTLTAAYRRLALAEKRLAHSVAQGVYPRLRAAEHTIGVTIPKDVAGLRTRTKAIEAELTDLWKAVRKREAIIVDTAFVGAIALALSRLGLGNLRCPSFVRLLNRTGCGGFGLLEELLATEITVLAATDICDFANAAQTLAETIRPVLMDLVDVEDALVGCHGAERPQTLELPALRLPRNSLGLQLAA
jgi:hypothetical protein